MRVVRKNVGGKRQDVARGDFGARSDAEDLASTRDVQGLPKPARSTRCDPRGGVLERVRGDDTVSAEMVEQASQSREPPVPRLERLTGLREIPLDGLRRDAGQLDTAPDAPPAEDARDGCTRGTGGSGASREPVFVTGDCSRSRRDDQRRQISQLREPPIRRRVAPASARCSRSRSRTVIMGMAWTRWKSRSGSAHCDVVRGQLQCARNAAVSKGRPPELPRAPRRLRSVTPPVRTPHRRRGSGRAPRPVRSCRRRAEAARSCGARRSPSTGEPGT